MSGWISSTGWNINLAAPGPIGNVTPSTGAFTTLSASSTVSGTGFNNYLASPPAIGGTAAAAGSFTTLNASSNVTLSGGTANGVVYLDGSKNAASGNALTFNGTNLSIGTPSATTGVGLNVYAQQAIFGDGGGGTGPRAGFLSSSTNIGLYLDNSVTANGSGFASGSDYAGLNRIVATNEFQVISIGSVASGIGGVITLRTGLGTSAERVRVDATGNVSVLTGVVSTAGYTVATLPSGVATGSRAYVTDALTPTSLTAVVGGGAVVVPVFYNGSAWIVG